jgi:hypothetical protein
LGLAISAATAGQLLDLDPALLVQCRATLDSDFAKLEAEGRCDTLDDAAAIDGFIEGFVSTVTARVACPCR